MECFIADFCKVCVAIFLFLSGYGLYKSYLSFSKKTAINNGVIRDINFVKNHLIKLMSSYWFIFIIFVPIGLFFDRSFISCYDSNIIYYLADFLGLSYLFFGFEATMNPTWWFMSIIIVYYLIFPLLMKIMNYSAEILVMISGVLFLLPISNYAELGSWLLPFVFGMYISKYDLIQKLYQKLDSNIKPIIFCMLFLFVTAVVRYSTFDGGTTIDAFFAIAVVLFSCYIISKIPVLNKILEELGKYSGLIFMFHTFIYNFYFKEFIYWFKYSIIIYIVMILLCYAIARFLTWVMETMRYNKFMDKLISRRG